METIGGDGSKTELDMKKKGKHKSTRYQCQPHPGLQGIGGEQHDSHSDCALCLNHSKQG